METKSLWSPNIITAAVTKLFKVPIKKKKMNKVKRVSTLPVMSRAGLEAPQIVVPPPPVQTNNTPTKRSTTDFIFGKVIGEGSFSTVYLTKDIHTSKEYAIKVCDKGHIVKEHKAEYVKREKDALNMISASGVPFFVKLYCTFQDLTSLYFVLTYAKNGELLSYINKVGALDIECTKFYSGEILQALEHLKKLNIIHRDLKPENILLDENMHILITDFGSSKIMDNAEVEAFHEDSDDDDENQHRARSNSFVGTAQYVSPELLNEKSSHFMSDIWALGCIIYQMVSGLPPFRGRGEYSVFTKITSLQYEFPEEFDLQARDLVEKMLVLDPKNRLAANDRDGYPSIKNHPLFDGVNFETLHLTTPPAISPFLPPHDSLSYQVPDHLEPGLNNQLSRLLGLEPESESPKSKRKSIVEVLLNKELKAAQLEEQKANSKWHALVGERLILKQGIINKRKGLFPRRRMLLLTEGPHLFYADPTSMTLKGEIPWSKDIRVEIKSFKIFWVVTPHRTYYLEEPNGFALDWNKAIYDMKNFCGAKV